MAAHCDRPIRLRLCFDYPPPAVVDCRRCWLLVDPNACRVVADLENIIREKFEYSRGVVLGLFVEDFYLPHTESIHVVRDNDCVSVKVNSVTQVNDQRGLQHAQKEKHRKRERPAESSEPEENGVSVEHKKKKKSKRSETLDEGAKPKSGDGGKKKSKDKTPEKKKKRRALENNIKDSQQPPVSTGKIPTGLEQLVQSVKKKKKKSAVVQAKTQNPFTSDSSSSNEEEEPKRPASTQAASKTPVSAKPVHPPSSSSSETDSSSDEAATKTVKATNKSLTSTSPRLICHTQFQPSSSVPVSDKLAPLNEKTVEPPQNTNDEEEIQLVIRKPMQWAPCSRGGLPSMRGRGRGADWRDWRGGGPGKRGRGEGRGGARGGRLFDRSQSQEPTCLTDSLTNVSVVLQNGEQHSARRDYSSMPILAAPPLVGQSIAFKLLELTENYTPEVSNYKEGKIVSFDPTTKQIELELLNPSQAPVEPGKFDLVYQNPDGSEWVEYAVSRGSRLCEHWDSLLEPRLVI